VRQHGRKLSEKREFVTPLFSGERCPKDGNYSIHPAGKSPTWPMPGHELKKSD